MSEVLGDAEPADDPRDDFDDYQYDDGFDREPGRVSQFLASVATPEALAIAGLIIATASLLSMPAIGVVANSLALSHPLTPTFVHRADAVGELIIALIGGLLAGLARLTGHSQHEPATGLRWVAHASGAAMMIAALSAAFAIIAVVVAGTAHLHGPGISFLPGSSASIPVFPEPEPSIVLATPVP